jgi:2'-hydroxyisoflavone reductase
MNRRDALKFGAAATAGLMLARLTEAQTPVKPLRVLIFGGTGFIGPHFVEVLRARGHKLTLFNRGKRNPKLFPDVETLIGDRNGQVDAIKGRDWDVVIDDSGYTPKQVKLTTDALKGRVQHYIFVSSISVYADLTPPGIDEDYKVATLSDPTSEEITDATYGALKALCEKTVEQTFGAHSAVIRPSYIVGPGDTSDRFTYWPVRTSQGGEMLAPGSPTDPIQFIDVRDLAEFMRGCVEQRFSGTFNACNPPGAVTIGDLLETSKRLSGANTQFVWAPAEFLDKNKALETGEVPIWAPPVGELAGANLVSSARAVAKGMRFRPVETTVRDLMAWHKTRPAEQQQKLRAGFAPEKEAQLLKALKGQ